MRDSACTWYIVENAKIFYSYVIFFFFLNLLLVRNTESRLVHETIKRTEISWKKSLLICATQLAGGLLLKML